MYSDFVLIDENGAATDRWERLPIGDTAGRNEAWLRDTIFRTPEILPIKDIDPAFGPLAPLCTELRTLAGPIDDVFINRDGKLTIVECKLWRNPQARREVVAQILDYARTLTRWSYSDLQRQVCARLKRSGNVPFELARNLHPELNEREFVDATTRALRGGRFLMISVGDGIREDVEAIADLINGNAAAAFQLAIVEAALYAKGPGTIAVQTRLISRTRVLERSVVVVSGGSDLATAPFVQSQEDDGPSDLASGRPADRFRPWWAPVLAMRFDDPDQPPPAYYTNSVRAPLPWPRLSINAYRDRSTESSVVFVGGPKQNRMDFREALGGEIEQLKEDLPGLEVGFVADADQTPVWMMSRKEASFPDEAANTAWIKETMNAFANALRPRMLRLIGEGH